MDLAAAEPRDEPPPVIADDLAHQPARAPGDRAG